MYEKHSQIEFHQPLCSLLSGLHPVPLKNCIQSRPTALKIRVEVRTPLLPPVALQPAFPPACCYIICARCTARTRCKCAYIDTELYIIHSFMAILLICRRCRCGNKIIISGRFSSLAARVPRHGAPVSVCLSFYGTMPGG